MTGRLAGRTDVAALALALLASVSVSAPVLASAPPAPENLLPTPVPTPTATPAPVLRSEPVIPMSEQPMVQPTGPALLAEPVMSWSLADAQALLQVIQHIDREGLIPGDYQPAALAAAIAAGAGPALDAQASRSFDWLAEDLRDGRTPPDDRIQWFVVDHNAERNPTDQLLARALASHDIAGVLAGLDPTYPDYAALRDSLAATPAADKHTRDIIRINMDRWRWMPHELGNIYLMTNVPEFQLRLNAGGRIIRTYRTIVGKPGRTATPQLAEKVQAVVFNPTWTVPQSIIEHEGLATKLLGNPAAATRQGYKVTKGADGSVTIVQQPGPKNSLGLMKIDMPNPHAIYLHDTPSKALFNAPVRAFSHGCVRTQGAVELGITMAIVAKVLTPDQARAIQQTTKYTRVPFNTSFPVYITYFTMARDINGQLSTFNDIYGRDDAVLASFAQPRQPRTTERKSHQEVIIAQDPL